MKREQSGEFRVASGETTPKTPSLRRRGQGVVGRQAVLTLSDGSCERISVPDVASWMAVAKLVASKLRPGMVVTLTGELGAGKTTFVQALVKTLGSKRVATSPTFALMRAYQLPKAVHGVKRLIHIDAYRIEHEEEFRVLDLEEELQDGESAAVIEWPEKISQTVSRFPRVVRLEIS